MTGTKNKRCTDGDWEHHPRRWKLCSDARPKTEIHYQPRVTHIPKPNGILQHIKQNKLVMEAPDICWFGGNVQLLRIEFEICPSTLEGKNTDFHNKCPICLGCVCRKCIFTEGRSTKTPRGFRVSGFWAIHIYIFFFFYTCRRKRSTYALTAALSRCLRPVGKHGKSTRTFSATELDT